ncbi:hypothetical protein AB0D37_34330 [Streptomyces sp. NPDC048384]|uniref:hypothetical protein n=1 Tax=unclassified Streptomyces TaxID=2593676 RepID=UPI00341A4417
MGSSVIGAIEHSVSGEAGGFWVVDESAVPVGEDEVGVVTGAMTSYRAVLWPGTPSARVGVEARSGPPREDARPYGDPFHCPSGAVTLYAGGERVGDVLPLDGPGVYWCLTSNGMQLSGGDPVTYRPGEEDPYLVQLWRVPGQLPPDEPLFPGAQPLHVVEGGLRVSHGEFWLSARSGGLPAEPPVPDRDEARAAGGVIAVPTMVQDTRVAVSVSWWDAEPPAGTGVALGSCTVRVEDGSLRCWSVEGPGVLLAVPGARTVAARVWRRIEPGDDFRYERYDIRLWAHPGP